MRTVIVLALLAACGSDGGDEKPTSPPKKEKLVSIGVYPEQFQCDSLAPMDELQRLLGPGLEVANPASTPPPRGVARPCNYMKTVPASEVDGDAGPEETRTVSWSFDLDCRKNALTEVESLRKEYAAQELEGEAPVSVDVGRSGTDHRNAQLVFVDADAPCYVRVRGPDRDGRIALARLIEGNLTEKTAPREPPEYRRGAGQ